MRLFSPCLDLNYVITLDIKYACYKLADGSDAGISLVRLLLTRYVSTICVHMARLVFALVEAHKTGVR